MFRKHLSKSAVFLVLAFALTLSAPVVHARDWLQPLPKGMADAGGQVWLVPEAERPLSFVVLGLWPHMKKYYLLPELQCPKRAAPEQKRKIEEQFYWLNFEFSHGDIIKNLPAYTHLYVALPDPKDVSESKGGEKAYFTDYLKAHGGFTDQDIQARVHFFYSSAVLEWPQDTCKILGRDRTGRVIIGMCGQDMPAYVKSVKELVSAFPDVFVLRDFGNWVSAEGGDEDLIWTPDHRVALLAGRHRVSEYLNRSQGRTWEQGVPPYELIQEANTAFSNAVYGARVIFMPDRMLSHPELGSNEVFHLDMLACVLPNPGKGKPRAFVPVYLAAKVHYDALLQSPLSPEFVSQVQTEYAVAAEEFGQLGYEVVRLPFSDHPVRAPVNVVRYRDRNTGEYTVLLGKYPYHLPMGEAGTPQSQIVNALQQVEDCFANWRVSPGNATYAALVSALAGTWETMDRTADRPNPIFEDQAKLYRKGGYKVVPISTYAWGAGGLHCQLLY